MKKALRFAGLMKNINIKDPRIKSLGIVAVVSAIAIFGLAAVVLVIGALAFFQLASNSSISLDVNQLFTTAQTWLAQIVGLGQGVLQDLQNVLTGQGAEA